MRTPRAATATALERLSAPLTRGAGAAGGMAGLGLAALLVGGLGLAVRGGWIRTPGWAIAAWVGVLIVVIGTVWWTVRRRRRVEARALAEVLESDGAFRQGTLRSALEGPVDGTSATLFGAADGRYAAELDQRGREALGPVRGRLLRDVRATAALCGLGLVAFGAARPTRAPVNLFWRPAAAWAALVAPISLSVDRPAVDRGDTVQLRIAAFGRRDAVLWTRSKGEGWSSTPLPLDSLGTATRPLGPLQGDAYAFVTSGGRSSDTVSVRVRLPAFLGHLVLSAHYPTYLHLEDEPLPTGGDTLLLPAGTRLKTRGEVTAPLASAGWELDGRTVPLRVDGAEFGGEFEPAASGVLTLHLATADGAALGNEPVRVPVRLVPDLPPLVDVPVPGADTLPATAPTVSLVADVRDDHGLLEVTLETRRTSHRGQADPVRRTALPLPGGATDRALLSTALDLSALGMEPGDTLRYVVVARDNSPAGQVGRSREYLIVRPTAAEARTEQRQSATSLTHKLDSLVAETKRLQRQTDDLSRERQRSSNQPGDRQDSGLPFDEAKKAEAVARAQQEMLQDAQSAKEQLEELERSVERSGTADSAFLKNLAEVREQLAKAITPELLKQLQELQQALKTLDPQATKEALKKLAQAQEQLKQALERSRELFKRAALEGELSNLEQEAKDVVRDQQKWNEEVARADSAKAGAEEKKLAARTDSLAQGLEAAAKQLQNQERKDRLEQSAEQSKQAAEQMRQAAQSAKSGKMQNAKKQGEQAAQQLGKVPKDVKEEREKQQNEWREEVVQALDRALAETARLTQRQLAVSKAFARGATVSNSRAEQASIEEGVQKLLAQISAVTGKNALVSPQIGVALTMARLDMGKAREAVSSASANLREASEQAGEAVDALNVAAYQMLRSRGDVSGAASASGLAEAMQRMTQMAQQQGGLSQEGNNLLSLAGQQIQQQIQMLAAKQRAMADELERMRAQSEAGATKDLADEAKELARKLESGRLDRETVDRQERLFRRMLDAGRTLQGQEEDEKKERQSTTAKTDSVTMPPALTARLLGKNGEVRLPSWEELQLLSPEERRLVTDYFRRLSSETKR